MSDFLASRDAAGNHLTTRYLDEGLERIIGNFEERHKHDRIQAVVDSVIYEDGTLSGPDSAGMLQRVNDRIRAARVLGSSFTELTGEELRSKLLLHSTGKAEGSYSEHLADRAGLLLRILQDEGEARATTILQQMRETKWFGDWEP